MAGQLLGAYFKAVIGSMLGASTALLFPQQRKRIDAMRDDVWYEWDEYVKVVGEFHAKLGDQTLAAIGQTSALQTLPLSKAAGFDSLEKIFGNFEALTRDVVRDVPAAELIRTISFTRDRVVLECDTRVPPALLTGVFRGFLLGFGKIVTTEQVERRGATVRFTLGYV
ncbi:hypothetical protein [Corallococcus llansteffanensis]|nr:hypothetical protein [Corallococcus llansteffanensis]